MPEAADPQENANNNNNNNNNKNNNNNNNNNNIRCNVMTCHLSRLLFTFTFQLPLWGSPVRGTRRK
jgi:hypothetical protein